MWFAGIWLGSHGLRAYLMMVVWNVAEDGSATQHGAVALGVWIVGLLGWVPARLLGPTLMPIQVGLGLGRQAAFAAGLQDVGRAGSRSDADV